MSRASEAIRTCHSGQQDKAVQRYGQNNTQVVRLGGASTVSRMGKVLSGVNRQQMQSRSASAAPETNVPFVVTDNSPTGHHPLRAGSGVTE